MRNKEIFNIAKQNSLLDVKFDILADVLDAAPIGNFAELGVYKGGVAYYLAANCNKTVYLFDTFTGIPNSDNKIDGHNNGDFSDNSLELVKDLLKNFKNVVIIKGIFPESVNKSSDVDYSFVHLDADTYKSTSDGLNYFYPRLIKGGIILLDDWNWEQCKGVNLAINDFLESKTINKTEYETKEFANQFMIKKI